MFTSKFKNQIFQVMVVGRFRSELTFDAYGHNSCRVSPSSLLTTAKTKLSRPLLYPFLTCIMIVPLS